MGRDRRREERSVPPGGTAVGSLLLAGLRGGRRAGLLFVVFPAIVANRALGLGY